MQGASLELRELDVPDGKRCNSVELKPIENEFKTQQTHCRIQVRFASIRVLCRTFAITLLVFEKRFNLYTQNWHNATIYLNPSVSRRELNFQYLSRTCPCAVETLKVRTLICQCPFQ